MKSTVIIGVTGGMASGKTTVSKMFAGLGARVFNADRIAHEVTEPRKSAWRKIIKMLGKEILTKEGTLDREKIAEAVFSHPSKRKALESIIHPAVSQRIRNCISGDVGLPKRKPNPSPVIVIDAPLLIESGMIKMVDHLVVVTSSRRNRLKRLLRNGRFTRREFFRRIRAQMPLAKKVTLADYVICNDGQVSDTKKQVVKIWMDIQKNIGGKNLGKENIY